LSVPQFTRCDDVKKGNRPGFDQAAAPAMAKRAWFDFNNIFRETGLLVKEGQLKASMDVNLTNNGPGTIWIDSRSDV
jgi:D-aminoacyl-tRNA deacylase